MFSHFARWGHGTAHRRVGMQRGVWEKQVSCVPRTQFGGVRVAFKRGMILLGHGVVQRWQTMRQAGTAA